MVMNKTVCRVQRWVKGLAGGGMVAASEGLVVSTQAPCTLASFIYIYYLLENSALVSHIL